MNNIKQKLYTIIRNQLKRKFTNYLGRVVEEEDKLICYVNKRNCKKNKFEYIIKCKGIEESNQELAKLYKLDKPICYIIDDLKTAKHRIYVFGYDDCEVIIRNCQFGFDLNVHVNNKCTIENTHVQAPSSYLSIGATNLIINNMNIHNELSISSPLHIIFGSAESIEINDSNIGKENENTRVSIISNQALTIKNSKISGDAVKFAAKKITADKNSALIASKKVDLIAEDFNQISITSNNIIFNGKKISNNKKSVILEKTTDPLKIKRLELIDILKKVKFECEKVDEKKTTKYQESLNKQPISKTLRK